MTGNLTALFLAQLGFVGGHFLLSALPVRDAVVARIGERSFLAGYSLLMTVFLAWGVLAYRGAPHVELWNPGAAARYVPIVVMPFALVLAVLGLTTRNPTMVMGEYAVNSGKAVTGIVTITRHPFLWGAALWALAHLAANGDTASLLLFGGMALLALGGMAAIDRKRAAKLGKAWESVRDATSVIPFAAALEGRTRIDWAGIGWVRPAIALVLYVALFTTHGWLFGGAVLA